MLEYLKLAKIAPDIDRGLRRVLREGKALTRYLGGQATTKEGCTAIIEYLD